jgi:hypothetical protein
LIEAAGWCRFTEEDEVCKGLGERVKSMYSSN